MSVSIVAFTETNSLTLTKPTGTASGDLLVMLLISEGASGAPAAPAGWTTIVTFNASAGGATAYMGAFYLVAGGSEPATYTWTAGSGTTGNNLGAIYTCSGQDATTQIDGHSTASTTTNTLALPAMTASVTGDELLVIVWDWTDVGISTMPLSGTVDFNDATDFDGGHASVAASGSTGTLNVVLNGASSQTGAIAVLVKSASSGGTNHGSATVFGMGGIFDGLSGQGSLGRGLSGGAGLGQGLSGSGTVGGGLAGDGIVTAAPAASTPATFTGEGALGGGIAGQGSVNASSAATPSLTFTGMGALMAGLFGGQGIIPAVAGSLGGAIHGAATLLGMGAMLLGFGGHGDIQAQSAATPTQTLKGAGALGGGLSGSGAVNASSAATPGITVHGTGTLGTGAAGSGAVNAQSAATPSLTLRGMGALLAGLFAGSGTLPPPAASIGGQIVGIFRWLYTAAYNVLQQAFTSRNEQTLGFGRAYNVLGQTFAPRQMQTMVFGGTAFLLMTFTREPTDMVTPNSTIQVVMTAKKFDGTLMSNLATVTCTVTFPDGSTSAFALGSGITNTGSGTYTLQYVTKGPGENIEDWVGTDTSSNTAEFHNITPVSF